MYYFCFIFSVVLCLLLKEATRTSQSRLFWHLPPTLTNIIEDIVHHNSLNPAE